MLSFETVPTLEGNPCQVFCQESGKAFAAILAFSQPTQFGYGKTFEATVANILKMVRYHIVYKGQQPVQIHYINCPLYGSKIFLDKKCFLGKVLWWASDQTRVQSGGWIVGQTGR